MTIIEIRRFGGRGREVVVVNSWTRLRERVRELAKKHVFVSDLSGEAIEEGKGAKIRVSFDDQRRGNFELDVTASEAEALTSKGRKVARRGRRPRLEAA